VNFLIEIEWKDCWNEIEDENTLRKFPLPKLIVCKKKGLVSHGTVIILNKNQMSMTNYSTHSNNY
jgi:hypothetical protein